MKTFLLWAAVGLFFTFLLGLFALTVFAFQAVASGDASQLAYDMGVAVLCLWTIGCTLIGLHLKATWNAPRHPQRNRFN